MSVREETPRTGISRRYTRRIGGAVDNDLEMARSADLVEAEPIDATDLEFLDSSRIGDLAWSSPKEIRSPLDAVRAAIVAERKR